MTIGILIIGTMALSHIAAARVTSVDRRYHLWHSMPALSGRQREYGYTNPSPTVPVGGWT